MKHEANDLSEVPHGPVKPGGRGSPQSKPARAQALPPGQPSESWENEGGPSAPASTPIEEGIDRARDTTGGASAPRAPRPPTHNWSP